MHVTDFGRNFLWLNDETQQFDDEIPHLILFESCENKLLEFMVKLFDERIVFDIFLDWVSKIWERLMSTFKENLFIFLQQKMFPNERGSWPWPC